MLSLFSRKGHNDTKRVSSHGANAKHANSHKQSHSAT